MVLAITDKSQARNTSAVGGGYSIHDAERDSIIEAQRKVNALQDAPN